MLTSSVSCCSVYLESLIAMPEGPKWFGLATGFLYAGPNGTRWLVTNWHVVTGRRPDDPGMLINRRKPESPSRLRFKVDDPKCSRFQEIEVALYDKDGPTWIEGGREQGVDLALIRLNDRPQFPLPFSQTFARNSSVRLEPGQDVVVVGHPFMLGEHAPSAIWKNAMVASEREAAGERRPWILIDAPGAPGMSGSPVYRRMLDPLQSEVSLELLGVYAGAVGNEALETLRLGRVFPIDLVEGLLRCHKQGSNPFPPTY
jgi:hypothetical protein